ncbi:AbrB/MazE/SpoVT family DNA-binding domain-containing protein [Amycolatopsis taiwanensis]|uniref:AbrB/MazE/SpoVT family DNA-binding domain-containing protein n=1 Tax=Amycolatopsis taiwanensis TaxID=342230 RepID=UPI000A078865|nr:AbrB/MazE/SpoVT family DNA-binding domain-containing protein [Amycolatopsis taiwanensis]
MSHPHAHGEEEFVSRAHVHAGQVTLPAEVRQALHIGEDDEVTFTVLPDGDVVLRSMTSIPTDQKWFWTSEWQEGERAASEEIAAGGLPVYDDIDAMFADLAADG